MNVSSRVALRTISIFSPFPIPCIFTQGQTRFSWRRGSSRGKTGQNFFPWWKNAHRLYYALMQDPCTQSLSRWIRNFHTCPDLPRLPTISSDFLLFLSIPVMKISCDVSGDAVVSWRILRSQANTLLLWQERKKKYQLRRKRRERERERQRSFRLSISFNPTFPCRLLLSIYYKLFHWSPREAACPANRENTRVFHSIKFDKVRRRYRDSREFAVTVNRRWYKLVDSRLDHIDDIPARQPRDSFWKP